MAKDKKSKVLSILLRSGLCVALLFTTVAGTVFTMRWFNPPSDGGLHEARRHVEEYAISSVSFRAMDAFFPTETVEALPGVELPTALRELDFDLELSGQEMSFEHALVHTDTNALLIIKDGKVIYERYLNGSNSEDRFISWSMAKSIISILVGKALQDGSIASLEDKIDVYMPTLKGTVFEGASIKDLLMMRAGTSYREVNLFGTADVDKLVEQSLFTNNSAFTDISRLNLTQTNEPGDKFNYSTLTTSILGQAVSNATGERLADYMARVLWQPAGMQHSGFWLLDAAMPNGSPFAGGGYNATLRDFGRLGLMMLQDGELNGHQIVPKDWVTLSTKHEGDDPVIPNTPRGYGYHWWTFMGTDIFEAVGIHGQFISIDPKTDSVIVKLSYWPERGGRKYAVENFELMNAIRAEISK